MFEMTLPDPGEGLIEADIVRWLVAVGDRIEVNDPILEIETAKSIVELPSAVAGVVREILAEEGSTVAVGSIVMRVETDDTAADKQEKEAMLVGYGAAAPARRPRRGQLAVPEQIPETDQVNESYGLGATPGYDPSQPHISGPILDEPHEPPLPDPEEGIAEGQQGRATTSRPRTKPQVRRLARDLGIDLNNVVGTGPDGTILPTDVALAAAAQVGGRKPDSRIPFTGVRKQMSQAMEASARVPQASVWMEVDVTKTVELIEQLKRRREFDGLKISPIIVLARAVCLAIEKHPEVNSALDLEHEEIVVRSRINLGVAAATKRGLMVPNVKDAGSLNLLELAQALNALVHRVREGRMQPEDSKDGTFTITNVGVFGVEGGSPLLNPGESAILLLGAFNRRPWVTLVDGKEEMQIRTVATLSLTIDHRTLDGEQASTFLSDVASLLRDPELALLY